MKLKFVILLKNKIIINILFFLKISKIQWSNELIKYKIEKLYYKLQKKTKKKRKKKK